MRFPGELLWISSHLACTVLSISSPGSCAMPPCYSLCMDSSGFLWICTYLPIDVRSEWSSLCVFHIKRSACCVVVWLFSVCGFSHSFSVYYAPDKLDDFISTINSHLQPLFMQIRKGLSEDNGRAHYAVVGTCCAVFVWGWQWLQELLGGWTATVQVCGNRTWQQGWQQCWSDLAQTLLKCWSEIPFPQETFFTETDF